MLLCAVCCVLCAAVLLCCACCVPCAARVVRAVLRRTLCPCLNISRMSLSPMSCPGQRQWRMRPLN